MNNLEYTLRAEKSSKIRNEKLSQLKNLSVSRNFRRKKNEYVKFEDLLILFAIEKLEKNKT